VGVGVVAVVAGFSAGAVLSSAYRRAIDSRLRRTAVRQADARLAPIPLVADEVEEWLGARVAQPTPPEPPAVPAPGRPALRPAVPRPANAPAPTARSATGMTAGNWAAMRRKLRRLDRG
jgi:hypothetical protein